MGLWKWFCELETKKPEQEVSFWRVRRKGVQEPVSGVEVCTRLCGSAGCRCGGTMRGLYCVWSYYRD
ncbi:MAG: hypothetical protein K0R55_2175 [Sporomusa sp.]|jgi:hypothetical protein|nr:hypothetical protein [Sporomusa sp.]